jgi:hypothetical protein
MAAAVSGLGQRMDTELYARLKQLSENLSSWRKQAERLRFEAYRAERSGQVDDQELVDLEGTAGEIYAGIETFNTLLLEIAKQSATGPAEFAEVGDALHLVLLEVTEVGTRIYRARSAGPRATHDDAQGPILSALPSSS